MRLEVTRRAELAVQAMTLLGAQEALLKTSALAEELGTTKGFAPQVLGPLVKAGWVQSIPGPTGGYGLTPAAHSASVLEIIETIDGPTADGRCVAHDRPCGAGTTCALHDAWAQARDALVTSLAATPAVPPPNTEPRTDQETP